MIDRQLLPYKLVRTNRRTLALVVDREGDLVARAPLRMPLRDIESFIAQKERWILQKQAIGQKRVTQGPKDGDMLPFQGKALLLREADVPFAFAYHGALLFPSRDPLLNSLIPWLKTQAEVVLPVQLTQWEAATGFHATKLSFSTAQTRWGSMTSAGGLRLNLALLLCPPEIMDYVIVHELVHRKHLNHSQAFWKTVEGFMPDYRRRKAWLKQNNHLIHLLHLS